MFWLGVLSGVLGTVLAVAVAVVYAAFRVSAWIDDVNLTDRAGV